jgi:two-component system, cell cycle response regulator DivK
MTDLQSTRADSILIVDDDADNRERLAEYLVCKGFTVHAAPNGVTALDLADVLRPRVILMDLAMGGLDGLETTRRLKANARTRDATIVAVTGRAFATDRDAAHRAGCDFFIPKPYDVTALVKFVDGLLSTSTARSGASPPELRPAVDLTPRTGTSRAFIDHATIGGGQRKHPSSVARVQAFSQRASDDLPFFSMTGSDPL